MLAARPLRIFAGGSECHRKVIPYCSGSRQREAQLFVSLLLCLSGARPLCAQSSTTAQAEQSGEDRNRATISHHTAQVNGIKYHYVLSGSGPTTVVLLHGWPTTWYHWRTVIPKLAKRYAVVAPDLRGLGLTEKAKLATTNGPSRGTSTNSYVSSGADTPTL